MRRRIVSAACAVLLFAGGAFAATGAIRIYPKGEVASGLGSFPRDSLFRER